MNAVRNKDSKFEASARRELELLMKLANWQTAECYQFLKTEKRCSNGEKRTQEKTGLRSRFVEMSVGQDKHVSRIG